MHYILLLLYFGSVAADKYLLLDDRNVISSEGSVLVLGKVEKHPAGAMIREERDYEMRFDNMQPNVWYDPVTSRWKAWYSAFTSCSVNKSEVPLCKNAPQQCGSVTASGPHATRGSGFLYAESDDGINWRKPDLGLVEWKGHKANNLIQINLDGNGIYLDEKADASERYKISFVKGGGKYGNGAVAVSADGLHWKKTKPIQSNQGEYGRWDTPANVVWDAARKQWIMYIRSAPTVGGIRVQSYIHSLTEDFLGNWSVATPTGLNSSENYQPDGLVVFPYEGIFLGIGNVFNPIQTLDPKTTKDLNAPAVIGQVNMVLAWSADGRQWKWIVPNESIIPLGMPGDFDSCGVFGAKQDPLRTASQNDTLRLYYAGCNGPFFGSRGCALGMATLQRDGFAGYKGGIVKTVPIRVSGSTLKVSVDGGNGVGVRVGIVGDDAFGVETCDPIKGPQTDFTVSWNGKADLKSLLNGAVSLEFIIPDDAVVFAFSFANAELPKEFAI